jgi:F-type H+-transporting ATPase subunit a
MRLFGMLGALQEAGSQAATPAESGSEQLRHMLLHHLSDGKDVDFEVLGHGKAFDLSVLRIPPIHIGSFTLDLSPTRHIVWMVVAALVVLAVFLPLARVMKRKYTDRAPRGFANAVEAMVLFFRDEVVRRGIGEGADAYTPYILTLFFFILALNLLGLVPWGGSATGNLAVTGALAILTLILVEVSGMRALGFGGYLKTIFYVPPGMNPVFSVIMLLIMTPVEIMGKLAKPFALAVRLFANMIAGHTLILSLLAIIFVFANLTLGRWGVAAGSVAMSSAIMVLEVFVAFLQAYIFAMLTAVFVGLIRHAH